MIVKAYHLKNNNGLTVTVLNYGAIIQAVTTPQQQNLVLAYQNPDDYVTTGNPYFYGAIIGRLANRVENAQFTLGDRIIQLDSNENQRNCLHSGKVGLHQVFWQVTERADSLELYYHSVDGEAGFPGNVDFTLHYRLTDNNELIIDYHAKTDQITPIDLTNHSYWNLSGNPTVLDDEVTLSANRYLIVDSHMIPNGEQCLVEATPLDFQKAKTIGRDIQQLTTTQGYDHYFVANNDTHDLTLLASIHDPHADITLEVSSTQPGFQFYTGNFLAKAHHAFCIEAQNYPNAINQTTFPSPLVSPDKPYQQQTVYNIILPKK